MTTYQDWAPEDIPQIFWERIARAGGDPEAFRMICESLSRDELDEMFHQFTELAEKLFLDEHYDKIDPDLDDMKVLGMAKWVVQQGHDYYWAVRNDPEKLPSPAEARGSKFLENLLRSYNERFDAWPGP